MTLSELIYARLKSGAALAGKLTVFEGSPAIFNVKVPGDTDIGWTGPQCPRIVFSLDMQANSERQSLGRLTVDIISNVKSLYPEDIEVEVRALLRDVFMTPTGEPPYCLTWNSSDNFEINSNNLQSNGGEIGITCLFDVLAFPAQITTDPDPILALSRYIKAIIPESVMIGQDKLTDYFSADILKPAFYARLNTLERDSETYSVIWMQASLGISIISPTAESRLKLIKHLTDAFAIDGEITMLDGSPMTLRSVVADISVDYLTGGQIALSVRYGILRRTVSGNLLSKIYYN